MEKSFCHYRFVFGFSLIILFCSVDLLNCATPFDTKGPPLCNNITGHKTKSIWGPEVVKARYCEAGTWSVTLNSSTAGGSCICICQHTSVHLSRYVCRGSFWFCLAPGICFKSTPMRYFVKWLSCTIVCLIICKKKR